MGDLDFELARDFGAAILLGALIGIERERRNIREGFGIAGLRSFVLLALIGAVGGHLARSLAMPWILPTAVAAATAAVVAGHVAAARLHPESIGITSELAAIATCLYGALVTVGQREIGIGLGVGTAALLAYKRPLHGLVGRLRWDDVQIGLRFLLATFIVLPLLPDEPIDPWGAIRPHRLWLLVLLISGLSLVGYVGSIWLGPRRGVVLIAVSGGLVSSTAVTLALVKRSREPGAEPRELAAGVLLAWAVMAARILVVASIAGPAMARILWAPCAAMALVGALGAALCLLKPRPEAPVAPVALANPFSLWAASKFALLIAAVQLLLQFAQNLWPRGGAFSVAVLAGLTDVDAITLSMAQLTRDDPAMLSVGTTAVVLASLSNTVGKVGMTLALGRGLARYVLPAGLATLVAGGIACWLAAVPGPPG